MKASSKFFERVLLAHEANPKPATKDGVETGGFMRDCRNGAETPLHPAAALGDEDAIQILLDAGAEKTVLEASRLRGNFRIYPNNGGGMTANLLGKPHV